MKTLKNIHEGYFDNITPEITTKPLYEFISEHTVIKAKGKEYLLVGNEIYDLNDFKARYISLLSGKGIEEETGAKKVREVEPRNAGQYLLQSFNNVTMILKYFKGVSKDKTIREFYFAPVWGLGEKATVGYYGVEDEVKEKKIKEIFG